MGKIGQGAENIYASFLGANSNGAPGHLRNLYRMYERMLTEVSCNRFAWTGLPKTVNQRFMETTMFHQGFSLMIKHPDNDQIVVTQGVTIGVDNMFQEPIGYSPVGIGLDGLILGPDECVPIWTNYLRYPDWDAVQIYAQRLADFDRTIEINGINARHTKFIAYDQQMEMTMANIDRQMREGVSSIRVSSEMGEGLKDHIAVLDLGGNAAEIVTLSTQRSRYLNEIFGFMGINGANQDKKERLIEGEVNANDEQVDSFKIVALQARNHAAERMKDVFGLTVKCDFNLAVIAQAEAVKEANNVNIHDSATGSDKSNGGNSNS